MGVCEREWGNVGDGENVASGLGFKCSVFSLFSRSPAAGSRFPTRCVGLQHGHASVCSSKPW